MMIEKDEEFEYGIERQIENIVKRLREARETARISQKDLSYAAGLSQNQVNYIETGQRVPNLHTLLRICSALNISPAVLFPPPPSEARTRMKETIVNLVSKL